MSPLDFAAAHPWWSVAFILAAGQALAMVAAAPVREWARWHRHPYDCPRCNGTGRDGR